MEQTPGRPLSAADERTAQLNKLARDVLEFSRNSLLVNLRFLDAALGRLTPAPSDDIPFATDGEHLIYTPLHILRAFKAARENTVRDYLHIILHCVFRHMFVHSLVERTAWDLACDIAAESVIAGLDLRTADAPRAASQTAKLAKLRQAVGGGLTAERLYRYFLDSKFTSGQMEKLREIFYADDHGLWYLSPDERRKRLGLSGAGSGNGGGDNENGGTDVSSGGAISVVESDWKGVSERMQVDMETFAARQQGERAGNLLQNLREVNRERYDYTEFLKKFAVHGEVMKVNDEEFDYVFYTYGLSLYRNLPLIEPLEYKDVKRIREFVIAIDTSGSVAGEIVQAFIQKTYNILLSTESFFSRINLHIIQCDAQIQEHVKITRREEFDEYLRDMKIRGLGGTDFRPVFALTNQLIHDGEFVNLKGLIYFTDGYGTFPEKKPDYETAFIFLEDNYQQPEVPPWAVRLILRGDEL